MGVVAGEAAPEDGFTAGQTDATTSLNVASSVLPVLPCDVVRACWTHSTTYKAAKESLTLLSLGSGEQDGASHRKPEG